jgi:hypothetical protein
LALIYFLWAATVIVALFTARSYHLDSYNVGWGDAAADHRHAVLWWGTIAPWFACLGFAILIGVISRVALCSIAVTGAIVWILALLGAHGPTAYRIVLFIPQLPGFFAAVMALGVHGDEHLTTLWAVGINTVLYAPILHIVFARAHKQRSLRPKVGEIAARTLPTQ